MQKHHKIEKVPASGLLQAKISSICCVLRRPKPLLRLVFALAGLLLLQAQVPYEHFEIAFIEPALVSTEASGGEALPSAYGLDPDTGVGGALSLYDAFDPPVGSYQRQVVYEDIVFEAGRLSTRERGASFCEAWSKIKRAETLPSIWRRARYEVQSSGYELIHLPSDSPDMMIESLSVERLGPQGYERLQEPELLRCAGDIYAIASELPGRYRIDYKTYSPIDGLPPRDAGFFEGQKVGASLLDAESDRTIRKIALENKRLSQILATVEPLPALIRYFQAFESENLMAKPDNGQALLRAILVEKRGLCRHRSLAFAAIARAWGFDVRIVANEAHAFVEILHKGRYYPVELGGRAESIDLRSPFSGGADTDNFDVLGQNEAGGDRGNQRGSDLDLSGSESNNAGIFDVARAQSLGSNGNSEALKRLVRGTSLGFLAGKDSKGRGRSASLKTASSLEQWLIFLPSLEPPARVLRDRQRFLAGRLVDYALMPLANVKAQLYLSYPNGARVLVDVAQSERDGQVRFGFRLDPNATLGSAEFEIFVAGERVLF